MGIRCEVLSLASAICFSLVASRSAESVEPMIRTGDRIALVGGTFVERMQHGSDFETALQRLAPGQRLVVRNIGWSGDNVLAEARAVFGQPQEGYARLQRDLEAAGPSVVMLGYGFASAIDGPAAVERFAAGLGRILDDLRQSGIRVIVLQPFHMPGVQTPDYDVSHGRVRDLLASAARDRDLPVIDLAPFVSETDFDNGLHLTKAGYRNVGWRLAATVLGKASEQPAKDSDASTQVLRRTVIEKNRLFFNRYRPQNETYLFLFRKHEQGNNAAEIPQFDPLIEDLDKKIHVAATAASR